MTFCEAKNSLRDGFYTCSENGTKTCIDNYHGKECKAYCKPSDNEAGHYSCGPNGEMICLEGNVYVFCIYYVYTDSFMPWTCIMVIVKETLLCVK